MLLTIGNATLCGDRRGRGAKTRVCFWVRFFAVPARPSAGIGVVEVQITRDPLRGSAWSRCKNSRLRFWRCPRDPLRGSAWSRCKNSRLRYLRCPRDPLRGSAWSRCKNSWLFCVFCGARATLCGDRRGRGAKTLGFWRFLRCARPLRRSCVSKRSRCGTVRFCCS